jgi:GT2 family glycosyltransferase
MKLKCIENDKIKVIINEKNYGFSKANNIALNFVPYGQYVWFLNNDTIINQNLVDKIKNNLPDNKTVLYFDILDFDQKKESSGIHYISLLTGSSSSNKKFLFKEYICGASIFLQYSENMPKWNDKYFLYFEDADFSLQLIKKGYIFKHIDDCFFLHKISASSSKNIRINEIKLTSQVIFMRNHAKYFALFIFLKILYLFFLCRFKELLLLINSIIRK